MSFSLNLEQRLALYIATKESYIKYTERHIYNYLGICFHINSLLSKKPGFIPSPCYHESYPIDHIYDTMDFLPELLAQKPQYQYNTQYWFKTGNKFDNLNDDPRIQILDKIIEQCLNQILKLKGLGLDSF